MKRTTKTLGILAVVGSLALALVLVAPALAQHGGFSLHGGGAASHDAHFAQVAAILGLNDAQKAGAMKVHEEAMAKAKPLGDRARAQHDELVKLLDGASPDPKVVGTRAIALYATHKQLEAIHVDAIARVSALLDPAQRAKFEVIVAEHMKDAGPKACFRWLDAD